LSADHDTAGDQVRAATDGAQVRADKIGERIRAEAVTAGYGGDPVIRGISLQSEAGQVVSIVGPNGSGKSTLLKSLVGVVRVSTGRVLVGDRIITNMPPEEIARAGVGYVPQVDDVFPPLSVRENLEMGGYLLPRKQLTGRIDHVLEVFPRLGTMIGRPAGKLSGGERKMLAMGRVLMLEPLVFLLDEPTANLAPAIATSLLNEHVRRLAEVGAAVLIVEQRAKAVLAISDYTYVLGAGELRMAGTPAELSASPDFVDSFLGGGRGRTAAEK
jgi:ABC-type branched-subunit amino acid transport system ATPase component